MNFSQFSTAKYTQDTRETTSLEKWNNDNRMVQWNSEIRYQLAYVNPYACIFW